MPAVYDEGLARDELAADLARGVIEELVEQLRWQQIFLCALHEVGLTEGGGELLPEDVVAVIQFRPPVKRSMDAES